MTEELLIRRVRAGDREAFRAIMQRCNQRLFRVARAAVGNDDEAEDVVQETYLRAYCARPVALAPSHHGYRCHG